MKNRVIRVISLVLVLATAVCAFVSCGSGKNIMTLGKSGISSNLYQLYLSRQKGTLCTTYYYGSKAKYDEFWDTTISTDGTTYNDYWTSYIYSCVKQYLVAAYLFDEELKLSLPAATLDAVEEKMTDLVNADGNGSKTEFNAVLSQFGVNYNMLKDSYLLAEKVNYVQNYLYGSDLSKVSDELKEQYYNDNYVRFKQVFFADYEYVYETDKDGTVIYYDTQTNSPVYDESGERKFDENGKALTDKNGSIIYYNADGTIAYDKVKGQPSYTYDENGNYKTRKLSDADRAKLKTQAEDMAEFTKKGDTDTFEKYINEYSDDTDGQELYEDGYYFAINSQYGYEYIVDIITELTKMETGEIRVVESDYGYHVIMKYELDPGAYADSDKEVWFETQYQSFRDDVRQWLFAEKCENYYDSIKVNQELTESYDMKSVKANYYY